MEKSEPAKRFEDLIVWQKSHQLTLQEVRYYFILSHDLGYAKDVDSERVDEVGRLLFAYMAALDGKP